MPKILEEKEEELGVEIFLIEFEFDLIICVIKRERPT